MATFMTRLVFFTALIFVVFASENGVPAILWSNTEVDFPHALAGHSTSTDEFLKDYLKKVADLPSHTLIVFVQDKLRMSDIIDNADVYNEHSTGDKFANLKKLVETHPAVHLPSVVSPGDAVDRLASEAKGKVYHLHEPFDVKDLGLDSRAPNFIICHLPANDGKSFDKVDKIIDRVTSDMKSMIKSFTAVYTGRSANENESKGQAYRGRHLLQAEDKATFINITNCIYLYFEEMIVTITRINDKSINSWSTKLPQGLKASSGSCGNGTGIVVIKTSAGAVSNFEARFEFDHDMGYWVTKNLQVKFRYTINSTSETGIKDTPVDIDTSLDAAEIFGPKGFSYHCSQTEPIMEPTLKQRKPGEVVYRASVKFEQLQAQYGNIVDDRFGQPNDCQGFFSIPILSGIFAGLILASILAFGICMIVNISTMDRFDDPKGKTISVNVQEG